MSLSVTNGMFYVLKNITNLHCFMKICNILTYDTNLIKMVHQENKSSRGIRLFNGWENYNVDIMKRNCLTTHS